jgi:hypothetical protein
MQTTIQPAPKRGARVTAPGESLAKGGWRRLPLHPEEGWSTLLLLGLVLYSAVWSIQAVNWSSGLGILTWTTGVGLLLGLVAAKQRWVPRLVIHWVLVGVGMVFAFAQTAGTVPGERLWGCGGILRIGCARRLRPMWIRMMM